MIKSNLVIAKILFKIWEISYMQRCCNLLKQWQITWFSLIYYKKRKWIVNSTSNDAFSIPFHLPLLEIVIIC